MLSTMLGIGIGAMATFFADPHDGRRRRALAREQFVRASRKTQGALDTARDLADRTSGVMATMSENLAHKVVNDRRLVKRIRAAMGRGRSRRYPSNWAPTTQTLAAAAGLAASGLYIAKYARR
jgi:gas vesicle protein